MTLPLIDPDWSVSARVRAACSTRVGGVSRGPYASLNLGDHVGDDAADVAENRRRFADALQARPVFLRQVHGTRTLVLDAGTAHGAEADACITTERGIACTMMVADCMPVLFASADGRAVGAAHAGWRGLAGSGGVGVLESVVRAFGDAAQVPAHELVAWLGPCIGPEAFEVGDEVRAAFIASDEGASACFRPLREGKWLADLQALARRRLHAVGIASIHGNDGSTPWCTVANPSVFFSHRRDRVSGRFAAAIRRV